MRARKRFGQHFLEPVWVDKLLRAIDPQPDQAFVEIGPGRGALTRPLAARVAHVVAYEIDRDLARDLRESGPANVTVVEGDFLEQFPRSTNHLVALVSSNPPNPQPPTPNPLVWRLAGNLPYNVASPIMFRLVDAYLAGVPIVDATLMLQLEVAERLTAPPGSRDYGVLSILIRHCAEVDLLLKLPPGAFRPAPKVRSAVVRLQFHAPEPPVRNRAVFERVVKTAFMHRRKTLANALRAVSDPGSDQGSGTGSDPGSGPASGSGLARVSVLLPQLDLSRRPESLTIAEFGALADVFSSA